MAAPATRTFLKLLCLYVLLRSGFVQGQCYFPGGDLAIDHQPCDPYAYTSLCCQSGWTCLDNGLCIVTDPSTNFVNPSVGSAGRGACTNPQWDSTACGNFCLDDPVNDNGGTVISCGNQQWCCEPKAGAGACDCGSGQGTFFLQTGVAQTIIGVTGLGFTSTDVVPISSASATSSATSAASATASISSSSAPPVTVTATPPSTIVAASQTGSAAAAMGVTHSTSFIAGIAAASAVTAAAVVAILFWLFFRRRRQRALRGDYIARSNPTSDANIYPPNSETPLQDPEEYNQPFPTYSARSTPEPRNRSRHSVSMVPDHDSGLPSQSNLAYPPAFDPYAVPPRDRNVPHETDILQDEVSAAAPPSYRSNAPESARPRGNAHRTMPRVAQTWRPDSPLLDHD